MYKEESEDSSPSCYQGLMVAVLRLVGVGLGTISNFALGASWLPQSTCSNVSISFEKFEQVNEV